jgi:hypothetical protein
MADVVRAERRDASRHGSRWWIVSVDVVPGQLAAEGFEAAWIVTPLD